MSRSRPAHAVATKRRIWWWVAGATAIVVVVGVAAFATGWGAPKAPTTASPSPTEPTAATTETASASATPTPSATTASPTPSPSTTRPVQKIAYCKAWKQITTSSVTSGSDEGSVDFAELADLFSSLIKSYSSAAKAAPSSLDQEYATVVAFLKDMRTAVVAKDLDGIKAMIANLDLLNDHMATIQKESERICG